MNTRKILIITSSAIVVSGIGYITYTKFRNKSEINKIHAALDDRAGSYGSIEDFSGVFAGASYVSKMKKEHPELILLKGDYVTDYRKQLYDAMWGIGTDTDTIKSVFRKLKDKVQVAQIAESYQKNYNINLLDALKGDIDIKSDDMKELLDLMIQKPAFRIDK